ncbi:DUF4468 domain-containing protein [bacterium]|nr:DUF4468 domain-containing protein [bacterium]
MINLRLLGTTFLFVSIFSFAQETQIPTNEKTGLAEYTEVITVTGASAGDLYARALLWLDDFYPNPHGVVQSKDSAVRITGRHQFRLSLTDKKGNESPAGFVTYNFTMEFKDGKFRYVIDNINEKKTSAFDISKWEDKDDPNYKEERYEQFIAQTTEFFNNMIETMYDRLTTPIEEESSDW